MKDLKQRKSPRRILGMYVKLRKTREAKGALFPAANWETFTPGKIADDEVSLPVAYELEGQLLIPIVVGQPILVHRHSRNGVIVEGLLTSSPVEAMGDGWVQTNNSVYKVTLSPVANT